MLRPLQRIFGRESLATEPEPLGNVVELAISGYAYDCVIAGNIRLVGERVSDMINDAPTIVFHDALVLALSDGHLVEMPQQEVGRDELLAVRVVGPRGNPARRRPTRQLGVALTIGPYRVWGFIHSMPSADPLSALYGQRLMVPLTEVALLYERNGLPEHEQLAGLMVNRSLVERVNEPIAVTDDIGRDLDAYYGMDDRTIQPPAKAVQPVPTAGHQVPHDDSAAWVSRPVDGGDPDSARTGTPPVPGAPRLTPSPGSMARTTLRSTRSTTRYPGSPRSRPKPTPGWITVP